jgi:hypothetical protein
MRGARSPPIPPPPSLPSKLGILGGACPSQTTGCSFIWGGVASRSHWLAIAPPTPPTPPPPPSPLTEDTLLGKGEEKLDDNFMSSLVEENSAE